MQLEWLDWMFIAGYGVLAFGIGVYCSKRASASISEFFIAGGKLPWWLAGTSIVATTLAADTPLAVSGFIRQGGIYKNWLWWNIMFGGLMMVFFYARLWRRANLLTDMEFTELRYGGRPAAILRGFGAIFGGVITNCVTMGWVILAMTKILEVMLGWDNKVVSIAVLMGLALVYTILSGFWGVVLTDLIQFTIAMIGSITLAGIVLWKVGGPSGMVELIRADPNFSPAVLHFVPHWNLGGLALATFVIQVSVLWWGAGQGGGYIAQRLFATKNETHSVLAALWFNFAHYVLRPWPWIIVGLVSIVYFPLQTLDDPERAYPLMIAQFMPIGLRGLMVASLLAAFMSTIDTQLNWGASYLINDLYKRFMVRNASEKHYVLASRVSMLLIVALGAIAAWLSDSIAGLWVFLFKLGAGAGLLGLLRWYWWRPNAWSEISAMAGSLVIANGIFFLRWYNAALQLLTDYEISPTFIARMEWFYATDQYALNMLFIIAVCTAIWLAVTYLTRPVPEDKLLTFYHRVRPGGWWGPIAAQCP